MPNEMNRQRIIERLRLSEDMEMMRHDIEHMLDKELAKPEEEIDAQLVQELLDLLNAPSLTPEQKEAVWQAIEKDMDKPHKPQWLKIVLRSAAAVAAVFVLFLVTLQTAEAFRWTFLFKLLSPVAETFGIYSVSNPDQDQQELSGNYADESTEYMQANYSSIEEMPSELHGVRIVPAWMMDGYSFVQGSVHQEPSVTTVFVAYASENDYVFLTTQVFLNEEAISGYEFEQSLQEYDTQNIAGQQVTLYRNNQGDVESYSWIYADTHYTFTGIVSADELTKIIEGLMA